MNKKIVAAFCIVILIASVLTACGKNKGYLQAEDSEGYVRAFVTDENGETVLNEDGDIRIYLTNPDGEIVKDSNGVPRESSVAMPDTIITDKAYKTKEFTFKTPSGWTTGDGIDSIALSDDGLSKIQFDNMKRDASDYDELVGEEVDKAKQIVEKIKESKGTAELKEGTVKLTSNQIDAYYMLFDAEIEVNGKKEVLHTFAAYLMFEGRVYKAFYQTEDKDGMTLDEVVEMFNNLTLNHYVPETTTEAED